MGKKCRSQTMLNDDPGIVALERGLNSDNEALRGYRGPITELIREVRIARARAELADRLEAKLRRAEERINELMRSNARIEPGRSE